MARTAKVFDRVEPEIKEPAENVLDIQHDIPVGMKLPIKRPLDIGELTKKQLDAELLKGMNDIENDRVISADDVEAEMRRLYGIYGLLSQDRGINNMTTTLP